MTFAVDEMQSLAGTYRAPSPCDEPTVPLRVVTFNCWGLPDMITQLAYKKLKRNSGPIPKRTDRMTAIGQRLKDYDIVCLQEIWLPSDQELLRDYGADAGLIYSHSFSSGIIGSSGLQILSRYPIVEVYFHRYRINGHITRLDHGDYHAGKGCGFARILYKPDLPISVFLTHTIAQYSKPDDDLYRADRLSQVWELIRVVEFITKFDTTSLVIVAGDFNVVPSSLEYQMICEMTTLVDAYWKIHNEHCITIVDSLVDDLKKRLDYLFFKPHKRWTPTHAQLAMQHDTGVFYSDHLAVEAHFYLDVADPKEQEAIEQQTQESLTTEVPLSDSTALEISTRLRYGLHKATQRRNNNFLFAIFTLLALMAFEVIISLPAILVGIGCTFCTVQVILGLLASEEISALGECFKEFQVYSTHLLPKKSS